MDNAVAAEMSPRLFPYWSAPVMLYSTDPPAGTHADEAVSVMLAICPGRTPSDAVDDFPVTVAVAVTV